MSDVWFVNYYVNQKQYQNLFFLIFLPDPVIITDSKGKFLVANKRTEEQIGSNREEFIGKNFFLLYISLSIRSIINTNNQVMEDGNSEPFFRCFTYLWWSRFIRLRPTCFQDDSNVFDTSKGRKL